jgi:hypothetical protein
MTPKPNATTPLAFGLLSVVEATQAVRSGRVPPGRKGKRQKKTSTMRPTRTSMAVDVVESV